MAANGNGKAWVFYARLIGIVLAINGATVAVLLPQIMAGRTEVRVLRDNHIAHIKEDVVEVRLDVRGLTVQVKALVTMIEQHIDSHK